jgi:RimJ/RimL family protein N-acetyltransferase
VVRADHRHTSTARLHLDAVAAADLEPVYALHSDPLVWRHLPSGRHADRGRTSSFISNMERAWNVDGLGYWAARVHDHGSEATGMSAGAFVGVGGCARRLGIVWNIYYRLTPQAWGMGFAREIVAAARLAANEVDRSTPVVAYLLAHNHASERTAQASGLTLAWSGPDFGNSDPGAIRLIYSDRQLTHDVVWTLTSNR